MINRRKFIFSLTALMGGSLTAVGAKAFDATSTIPKDIHREFLTSHQLKTIERIADIIIPTTDTPGASAAGVHLFIDHMVGHYMSTKESSAFVQALDLVIDQTKGFLNSPKIKQIEFIQKLDDDINNNQFYKSLKEMVVTGYYTSKIGATLELAYDPVPGPYREIPLAEIGRAWAT